MFKVQDANGKEIEFSLEQIQDINSNIFSSAPHNVSDAKSLKPIEVPIVDSEGKQIGLVGDISKIVDSTTKELPKAIDVIIEGTHSGDNHNYAIYHSDSMEKDANTFTQPFNKPLIKNHDTSTEPLGRITDYLFRQSELAPDRDCIELTTRVTDKEAIEKFLDGRYKTVSISGSTQHVRCNICGKDILKDKKLKFCGHWKGQKYGDNLALWHMRDIRYNECSIVNAPADDWAQVKRIKIVDDSSSQNNQDNENQEHKDNENNPTGVIVNDNNDPESIIDNILDNTQSEDNSNPDSKEPDNVSDGEDTTDASDNSDENKDDLVKELEEKVAGLEDKINSLNEELELKDQDISSLTDQIEEVIGKLTASEDKVKEYKNISINLATSNKSLLADKLLQLKGVASKDLAEQKEEILKLSARDIKAEINELASKDKQPTTVTPVTKVTNPGLALNDKNTVQDDDNEEADDKPVINNNDNKNVVDSIINKLYK